MVSCVARSCEGSPVRIGAGEAVTRRTVTIALGGLVGALPGELDNEGSGEEVGAWIVGGDEMQAVNSTLKRRGHKQIGILCLCASVAICSILTNQLIRHNLGGQVAQALPGRLLLLLCLVHLLAQLQDLIAQQRRLLELQSVRLLLNLF